MLYVEDRQDKGASDVVGTVGFVRDHDHNICAGMCQALRQIDVLGDESRMVRVGGH